MKFVAGTKTLASTLNHWYVLDIGFSSKRKTCGVMTSDSPETRSLRYGELANDIAAFAKKKRILGLIIEAPLSWSFDEFGSPCGRSFEKKGTQYRYWYGGAGCAVMTASLRLLRNITSVKLNTKIVLFEGFASFKTARTKHRDDARALYDSRHRIWDFEENWSCPGGNTEGITSILGHTADVPSIIVLGSA